MRVFRSSTLGGRYAPPRLDDDDDVGYRYDGLYMVRAVWDVDGNETESFPRNGEDGWQTFFFTRLPKKPLDGKTEPGMQYNQLGLQELWGNIQKMRGVRRPKKFEIPPAPMKLPALKKSAIAGENRDRKAACCDPATKQIRKASASNDNDAGGGVPEEGEIDQTPRRAENDESTDSTDGDSSEDAGKDVDSDSDCSSRPSRPSPPPVQTVSGKVVTPRPRLHPIPETKRTPSSQSNPRKRPEPDRSGGDDRREGDDSSDGEHSSERGGRIEAIGPKRTKAVPPPAARPADAKPPETPAEATPLK